eukprot:TRINITY_DN6259_c0_g1_i2.p1 TRINITY_DN6259_c0_g1~~TRINITY_DN6259_c0_g1_i2.p1  ORF type:complete len:771 (+),score=144.63 TRINITY_DN6259_c0_g1_i2:56-2368(+)
MESKISWPSTAISRCSQNYHTLVSLLCRDPNYFLVISNLVDASDRDTIARLTVRVTMMTDSCLPMLQRFIVDEFEKGKSNPSTILRANSIASKMQTAYARKVSALYLKETVGGVLLEIIGSDHLSLEINPTKLPSLNKEARLEENRKALAIYAQRFLDQIVHPESISKMPPEIKAIARMIAQCADECCPSMKNTLVGGFIMLRFFNPAILTPESFELIPSDETVSDNGRRNLILITKLLQNVSNGVEFGAKEEYMIPMNSFVQDNMSKMNEYLHQMGSSLSDQDLCGLLASKKGDQEFSIHELGLMELAKLHRLVFGAQHKLTETIPTLSTFGTEQQKDLDMFQKLMKEMGPAPSVTKSRLVRMPSANLSTHTTKEGSSSLLVESPRTKGEKLTPRGEAMSFSDMEHSKFFYPGPTNKSGDPVFYLIASRTHPSFLADVNRIASYIKTVMGKALDRSFALAVDMSWSNITGEMQRSIFENISDFWSLFDRQQRKNLSALYIIHPSAFTSSVIFMMRAFVSRKFSRKIIEIYNWKSLSNYIDQSKTLLPEESRDYITKAYHVTKVNVKGKHQPRLLKFTQTSILNIDGSTKMLKNEKRLKDIRSIVIPPSEPEFVLHFYGADNAGSGAKSSLFSFSKNDEDSKIRRYVCSTIDERDDILVDLFERAFFLPLVKTPQESTVIKINKAGRHQERYIKLTCDSILNLHDQSIRSEISFAGIEECRLETDQPNTFSLKFKHEETKRKFICPMARDICISIQVRSCAQFDQMSVLG